MSGVFEEMRVRSLRESVDSEYCDGTKGVLKEKL